MSRRQRRSDPEDYLYVVDLFCIKDLDPVQIIRGYLRGIDPDEIQTELARWHSMKIKGIKDDDPAIKIDTFVRGEKICTLPYFPDLSGVENIRTFLRGYDQHAVITGLEYFERAMESFVL